jgi:hypothetical protein
MKLSPLGACLALVVVAVAVVGAVDKDKAEYVGGTLTMLQEKAEAKLDTRSDADFVFDAGVKGRVSIPYAKIEDLEYGQKAGRRVGVAILVSPLALFSKKRKHFVTVTYKDANDKDQVGVFELGKDIYRPVLKILEVRSGKDIVFQDTDACKQYKTEKECLPSK